jgi:hypothetical protein
MKYSDGSPIALGDIVSVLVGPDKYEKARVVMLGDTYEHLDIDERFVAWVNEERKLEEASVVVEWLESNPFAHSDPRIAPVGKYMFSPADEWLKRSA